MECEPSKQREQLRGVTANHHKTIPAARRVLWHPNDEEQNGMM